jgi:calcineurin-like phosphoesterase family protein
MVVAIAILVGFWTWLTSVQAQDLPFPVHDTRPVILNGPYLAGPSETGVTIVWRTDTPCHSKVLYGKAGQLDSVAEPHEHGLLPVGTLHAVHLSGLSPGQTYSYRVVSTRVVKLRPYWPEKGLSIESPVFAFTTFDRGKKTVFFSFITDTQHEDLKRLNAHLDAVDWGRSEFLAHGGDALNWVENEDQLLEKWLEPIARRLGQSKPLVFARGNHDMRGPFARRLYPYVPTPTGKFYYSLDVGPVHLVVLDTGEDKSDDTNVYAGLNRFQSYKAEEFAWLRQHIRSNPRVTEAPFRIVVMHAPDWGWVNEKNDRWTELANRARVDLVLAGHRHRFHRVEPGEAGNDYTILVVGQDQVAAVEASQTSLKVQVKATSGEILDSFSLQPSRVP